LAEALYDYFLSSIKLAHSSISSGVFGADMQVSLINDGPVVNFYLSLAHSLNQCFHYFDKYENSAI
jgi:hypothetical protein